MADDLSKLGPADASLLTALRDASRAERPRAGAKSRALAAVLSGANRDDARAKVRLRHSAIAAGVTGGLLAAAVIVLSIRARRQDAALLDTQAELAAQKMQVERLMAELGRQSQSSERLLAALASAHDDNDERAAIQQQLIDAGRTQMESAKGATSTAGRAGGAAGGSSARAACICVAGDPLCSCVP